MIVRFSMQMHAELCFSFHKDDNGSCFAKRELAKLPVSETERRLEKWRQVFEVNCTSHSTIPLTQLSLQNVCVFHKMLAEEKLIVT